MSKKEALAHPLLPYAIVEAAAGGDGEAVRAVIDHYAPYINALATETCWDQERGATRYVNEEIRKRLVAKLLEGILKFEIV